MDLRFSRLIASIDAEISPAYLGGAIAWADEHHGMAWSNAIDRFEEALTLSIKRNDIGHAIREGEIYKSTVLDLLSKYKATQRKDESENFLSSLKFRGGA